VKHLITSSLFNFIIYAIILTVIGLSVAHANSEGESVLIDESGSNWVVGTSITYPLGAQIYMIQASYLAGERVELLFGLAFQNWKNDQGQSHAYTILLGYRHYLWSGLHAEIELWPAYNPFKSSIDGKTYTGVELWTSLRLGYTFDLNIANRNFFILAQPSLGFGIARQNPWPDFVRGEVIFEPQLIVGMRL